MWCERLLLTSAAVSSFAAWVFTTSVTCLAGDMPKRYNVNNHPSYGRLVNYLYRIWDYDSCAEAQLKIWLAQHILTRNNPGAYTTANSCCNDTSSGACFMSCTALWCVAQVQRQCSVSASIQAVQAVACTAVANLTR